MRRSWLLHRGGLAVLLTAALLGIGPSSQADEWYPGLPDATFGNWANASQGSLSYARRAKQWFRSPQGMTTAEVLPGASIGDDPDVRNLWVDAAGYLISPKGAPANYGYMEPVTVRSVGFGLMPVEATVQVSQRRENGYPVPTRVHLEGREVFRDRPPGDPGPYRIQDVTYDATRISDRFNVRVLAVKVDGVNLGLDGNCRTVRPAPVVVESPEYTIEDVQRYFGYRDDWYRSQDPSTYYEPTRGGQLTGSMTIPPFTGCATRAGDDLSRLITLSVSGPDNPVTVRTGWQCDYAVGSANAPAPPGVSNPRLGSGHAPQAFVDPRYCPGIKAFDYPERPDE